MYSLKLFFAMTRSRQPHNGDGPATASHGRTIRVFPSHFLRRSARLLTLTHARCHFHYFPDFHPCTPLDCDFGRSFGPPIQKDYVLDSLLSRNRVYDSPFLPSVLIRRILPSRNVQRGGRGRLESLCYTHRAMHLNDRWLGTLFAFFSAVLFGISAPLGKLLLSQLKPLPLVGLLYLGSFASISVALLTGIGAKSADRAETPLRRDDFFFLGCAIVSGGVVAPILLFYGLARTPASVASLLLNAEAILTILFAASVFRERVGKRVWAAAGLMLCASVILVYSSVGRATLSGPLLVLGACLMWALDNNVTLQLAHKNPFSIARLKGLTAGSVTLFIAYAVGDRPSSAASVLLALLLGAFSYGGSLVLFIYALRHMGASRTATWFQTAPFLGAAASLALLRESLSLQFAVSGCIMLCASALLLREQHTHGHEHPALWHEHRHDHDEHHRHQHERDEAGPHAHPHSHSLLVHSHMHFPDFHHRHNH